MDKNVSIICFGHLWDKYRRRSRALMEEISRHPEVSSILYIDPYLTFGSLIKYIFGKADNNATLGWQGISCEGFNKRYNDKLSIYRSVIPFSPRYGKLLFEFSIKFGSYLILHQLKKCFKTINRKNDIWVWVFAPYDIIPIIQQIPRNVLIYDQCEDYRAKYKGGWNKKKVEYNHLWLLENANVNFVASKKYAKQLGSGYFLPNGTHQMFFGKENMNDPLSHIPHPRLLFVGKIGDDLIDVKALKGVVKNNPNWQFVMVGPVDDTHEPIDEANIHYLGEKPAHEITAYMQSSDILLSLKSPSYINKMCHSLKVFMYFASGKNIVASELAEFESYPNLVDFYNPGDYESLEKQIRNCLGRLKDDSRSRKRRELASLNTWDKIADRALERIIESY